MQRIVSIKTQQKRQIIDITDIIEELLEAQSINEGLCHIFVLHTTAAITTADLDPGTDLDMLDAFEKIIPRLAYRHPHDPAHTPDHILASLIGPSLTVPITHNAFMLGTWQRIVFLEGDGPRERKIVVTIQKTA